MIFFATSSLKDVLFRVIGKCYMFECNVVKSCNVLKVYVTEHTGLHA